MPAIAVNFWIQANSDGVRFGHEPTSARPDHKSAKGPTADMIMCARRGRSRRFTARALKIEEQHGDDWNEQGQ
jgi:hypothetical protein